MLMWRTVLWMVIQIFIVHLISAYPAIQENPDSLQSLSAWAGKSRSLPDVSATIDQVHKILQEDPTLPRLTRGEIKELFEQVTKEEYSKSLQTGDLNRASNMRALMLVMPYNTNNTTEDNLQELYTRPPITKVIDSYSIPQKFQTPSPVPSGKVEGVEVGNLAATTYKPLFRMREKINPSPTTYHPPQHSFMPTKLTTSQTIDNGAVTSLPLLPEIEDERDKLTRYSSSYSAKNSDWSLLEGEFNRRKNLHQKFTPMPGLSGIFQNMGMTMQNQANLEDYYQAAKPAMSSTIKQLDRYPGTIDIADFTRTLPPRPNPEAYIEFKPLNIGEEIRVRPEVEDYLNRYGIVNRKRKQIKPEDENETNKNQDSTKKSNTRIDEPLKIELAVMVANDTIKTQEQPIRRMDTNVDDYDSSKDQEDLVQLKKLLNNLRELERLNVSLTSEMLKTIDLDNFNLSSDIRAQGPDPVNDIENSRKNDIKRQSATETTSNPTRFNLDLDLNATESELTTTSTTSTTEEPSSTTEESRNGSLTDLEDSFGGPDPITEDPSPPPKKNGFYFLADWNSFLEVGEAGNDQVVVRFDPKIGDPRRFLKVTVP